MDIDKSISTSALPTVECRKRRSIIYIELFTVTMVCFVFSWLALVLLTNQPVIRIICVVALIIGSAFLIIPLAKNPPWLVIANKTLEVRCYPLDLNGGLGKAKKMIVPLERLERVWVGRVRDYPSGMLMNHADSRTFPWAITMVIWLKNENSPFLMREFSWLSAPEEFLKQLRTYGIRVERDLQRN